MKEEKSKIILIRHAESTFNAEYEKNNFAIAPTMYNPELTEKGKEQAIKMGQELDKIYQVEKIITSSRKRCRETLEYSNLSDYYNLSAEVLNSFEKSKKTMLII